MKYKIALAQIAPVLGKIEDNLEKHEFYLKKAREEKVDLVVFPELSLTGYELMDLVPDVALTLESPQIKELKNLSKLTSFFSGFVLEEKGIFYNVAALFHKGEIIHLHKKVFLPNYSMFEERRFFAEGSSFRSFDFKGARFAISICYDYLHPSSSYVYFLQKTEILVVMSASPARVLNDQGFWSIKGWEDMSSVVSRFFNMYVIYVNRAGFEGGMGFAGASHLFDPFGNMLVKLKEFEEDYATVEIDTEEVRRSRILFPALRDERPEVIFKEIKKVLENEN